MHMKITYSSVIKEFESFNIPYQIVRILLSAFPSYTAYRIRPFLFRLIGFSIGESTVFFDSPQILGHPQIYTQLKVGNFCLVGPSCYFDLAGKINIEDHVSIGPQVTIITGTHEIGSSNHRLGPLVVKDVTIGAGTWIGARCTILPGVTIGKGVILAAGAVVAKDIPANTMAGGVPAKVIRELPE